MGRPYAVDGNQAAGASVTILTLVNGGTTIMPELFYLTVGSAATPADQANNMQVNRVTADGAGTAVTPRGLRTGLSTPAGVALENHTAEPTYTANEVMLSFSFNTRASFQWYANPGMEVTMPATLSSGVGLRFVVATGTQLHEATLHYSE